MSSQSVARDFHDHLITVDEFHKMVEVGLFAPDARLELIEGRIIKMMSIGCPHASIVDWLNHTLVLALSGQAIVRVQGPVRLSNITEPVHDIAVLLPKQSRFRENHPSGPDTHLVIEVSDNSLHYDRKIKTPLYARYGVPEVWVVDARRRRIHFYRALNGESYSDVFETGTPGITTISSMEGVTVDLTEMFP